jgi:glyoxylase-like metal-dependent hydrolase (beta-lactamase superfamily II)
MSKAAAGSPLEANFKNVRRVFGAHGNKVTAYEPDKELVPGITSVGTYGHTPGHTSHLIASGNAKVMVQADVTAAIGLLFVRNPGWHAAFDMDGAMTEQTRRKLYDMAATDKLLIQGFHFPFPALGHIEKDGASYRMVPVAWSLSEPFATARLPASRAMRYYRCRPLAPAPAAQAVTQRKIPCPKFQDVPC